MSKEPARMLAEIKRLDAALWSNRATVSPSRSRRWKSNMKPLPASHALLGRAASLVTGPALLIDPCGGREPPDRPLGRSFFIPSSERDSSRHSGAGARRQNDGRRSGRRCAAEWCVLGNGTRPVHYSGRKVMKATFVSLCGLAYRPIKAFALARTAASSVSLILPFAFALRARQSRDLT